VSHWQWCVICDCTFQKSVNKLRSSTKRGSLESNPAESNTCLLNAYAPGGGGSRRMIRPPIESVKAHLTWCNSLAKYPGERKITAVQYRSLTSPILTPSMDPQSRQTIM